jgi:hypothetical protein
LPARCKASPAIRTHVDVEDGGGGIEARADEEVHDTQRSENVVAAFLLVEHGQKAAEARMGVGDDTRIVAGLIEHLRLDQNLPGERIHGSFGTADPPADPLID